MKKKKSEGDKISFFALKYQIKKNYYLFREEICPPGSREATAPSAAIAVPMVFGEMYIGRKNFVKTDFGGFD